MRAFSCISKEEPTETVFHAKNKAKKKKKGSALVTGPCVKSNPLRSSLNNVCFLLGSVELARPVGASALELSVLVLEQLLLHWIRIQKNLSHDPAHLPSLHSFCLPPFPLGRHEFENLT